MQPNPHPDLPHDYARLKQITSGGMEAIENSAIEEYMRVFEEKGREEAEKVFFSFFNKINNGQ